MSECGPALKPGPPLDPKQCVRQQPKVLVRGAGVTGSAFLANPNNRKQLFENLYANSFEMETATLAHVAYANNFQYIAFRSLSDLAGGEAFDPDVVALFSSGLAEANESAVALAFLEAWRLKYPKSMTNARLNR